MKKLIILFSGTLLVFIVFSSGTTTTTIAADDSKAKEGELCNQDSNCTWGLQCGPCIASRSVHKKCTRLIPNHPYFQVQGLPFNRYSWLTTRRSYARTESISPMGVTVSAPKSQEDSITEQLQHGIRGLMLDIYDYNNDFWLCFFICSNETAFQLAIDALVEVRKFLESNRPEIITIFLEDHVKSPDGLSKLFDRADLRKLWFPVSQMPKHGGDWPVIDDMINQNQRLVVFTSRPEKEASEGIAFKWNYIVENQYGNSAIQSEVCQNRAMSFPMNSSSKSLVMVNYFRSISEMTQACKDHSEVLINKVKNCSVAAANRWANYIALDFYKKSEGGEVAKTIDMANGQSVCGCDSITLCKADKTFGDCSIA